MGGAELMMERSSSCFFNFWIARVKWITGSQGGGTSCKCKTAGMQLLWYYQLNATFC